MSKTRTSCRWRTGSAPRRCVASQVSTMIRPRPGPMARVMRFHGPPAFYGVDRGNRGAPGFSRHTHRVGMALTLRNLWCAPQCNLELSGSAPPPSANGTIWSISSRYREPQRRPLCRSTQLQQPPSRRHTSRRTAAGMYRDREPRNAPKQLNAARCRSTAGGVLKPLRRRTREPVAAPHRSPRHAAFAGFEMHSPAA